MTISITKASSVFEHYRNEIAKTRKDAGLSAEGKLRGIKKVAADLEAQLAYWKQEVTTENEKIETEVAKNKPDMVNRKYDSESVAALNYQAKVLQSRIAAEGGTKEGFSALLLDIVDGGNETTRQAFMDSYHDISALAENFDHNGKDYLQKYYNDAKEKMKTPEQVAFEKAVVDGASQQNSWNMQLFAVEKNTAEFKASFSADLHGHEEKPKTIWD